MNGDRPTEGLDDPVGEPTRIEPGGPPADPTEPMTKAGDGRWSPPAGSGLLVLSIWASVALTVAYILAGGLDYKPAEAADPCQPRVWSQTETLEQTAEQFALSALDGAACDLGVSRAELTRALATPAALNEFTERNDLTDDEVEEAIRAGAGRAIDDGEAAGAIPPTVALGLRLAVRTLPLADLIDLIQGGALFLESEQGQSLLDDLLGAFESGQTPDGGFDLGQALEGLFGAGSAEGEGPVLPEGLEGLLPEDSDSIQEGLEGLFGPP